MLPILPKRTAPPRNIAEVLLYPLICKLLFFLLLLEPLQDPSPLCHDCVDHLDDLVLLGNLDLGLPTVLLEVDLPEAALESVILHGDGDAGHHNHILES